MTATTNTAAELGDEAPRRPKPKREIAPLTYGRKGNIEIFFLWVFVLAPWVALAAGIYLTANTPWAMNWTQAALFVVFYVFTGLGITIGFHRYLTHGAFKAKRPLKIMLTLAGTMAIEGGPIRWVADHRRHHQFSDEENDPHSPWRFGHSLGGLTKGLIWAHTGWLFTRENTNSRRFAPDLIADPDIRFFQKKFVYVLLFSLLLPTALGGLLTWSWQGAVAGYIWAGLVRIALVHHVTWSVNSVCHVFGERPFTTTDKASNVWWLAILSFGESWHNLHHADPTSARHGVDKGQIDISARTIWLFEKAGWAYNVRWPKASRLDAKRKDQALAA
ncbi:acyl-CoA desaturase [Spongisporangium articulatum]|uniref:Acyl-CoA desaturase n=1 Tax=Spongisporangium articulatum TaxID=3362603 RepID=A0ABW8AHE3_9ACTN